MKDNQRVTITKRMLREGLLRLLKTSSLEEISVTQLCREAQINRTTFYRHYELPRDVLFEMESDIIKKVRSMISKPGSLQDMERDAEKMLTYLYEQGDVMKILIEYRSDENFTYVINEFYHTFLEFRGQIREVSNLDDDSAKLLSTYVVGGIFFLLRQWLVEGIVKTPKEISALLFRFVDKGLAF